ncbi:hypothetical protein GPECTOR_22g920 [Gonium pectorale]|uniref:Hexosyltransferase n=1 Tax=Gonium pectorale TaxID=33097 RepID=A0A150GHM2_GONPE|nr:hypothetical protein GPECTOR_22g920 [Gonium pectorale]|eukprot:KXZ49326.1 hypothetical protein GPECTOR_22g920 [Gonium pectorale]
MRHWGAPHRETYTIAPDFPGHPPVVRLALAPRFAFDAFGDSFKWLLLGDDDTVFVLPAVLRLLNEAGLDANEPHMISDYQYVCRDPGNVAACDAPAAEDRRCLPCPQGQRFCPCRLPPECTHQDNWRFENCTDRARNLPYGGVGVIYSVGMMRLLAEDPGFYIAKAFRDTVPAEPWGDRTLGDAPRIKGYGFTNLTAAASQIPIPRFFGTYSWFNDGRNPQDLLSALREAARNEPKQFGRTVSVHVRTATVPGDARQLAQGLLPAYEQIVELFQRFHAHLERSERQRSERKQEEREREGASVEEDGQADVAGEQPSGAGEGGSLVGVSWESVLEQAQP